MKNIVIGIFVLLGIWFWQSDKPFGASQALKFVSPTQATSTAGIYAWSRVLTADSSRVFASLCNASPALPTTNDVMFIALGATSTPPYGITVSPGKCYEMTLDNMFWGDVYARASTSTSTLTSVYK